MIQQGEKLMIMKFQSLVGVLIRRQGKNIGLEEILGVNIGEKTVCSESFEELTI